MPSLMNRLTQFANSPKGKQAIRELTERGQQLARDPRTRAKLEEMRRKLQGGQRGGPQSGHRP